MKSTNEFVTADPDMSMDVTERRSAEKELRLMQFAVVHASDAVFCRDSQGCIVYANEAACRSVGRSREELLSSPMSDINPLLTEEAQAGRSFLQCRRLRKRGG